MQAFFIAKKEIHAYGHTPGRHRHHCGGPVRHRPHQQPPPRLWKLYRGPHGGALPPAGGERHQHYSGRPQWSHQRPHREAGPAGRGVRQGPVRPRHPEP